MMAVSRFACAVVPVDVTAIVRKRGSLAGMVRFDCGSGLQRSTIALWSKSIPWSGCSATLSEPTS